MKKVGVAILGLGVVGGGTYEILVKNRENYKRDYHVDVVVESVLELRKERAIALGIIENKIANNIQEICSNPDVDIVVEVMGGVEPAKTFVLSALNAGKSVVTSNKELYCKFSHELEAIAKKNHCGLFYEATCVGGVPIIRAMLDNLQCNNFVNLTGIVNGTTNYILTKMSDSGVSYQECLREAQALGYAEADPTSDVEGFDSMYKLSILSSIAFRTKIPYTKIYREGISNLSITDIQLGKKLGYTIKLLAIGKKNHNGVEVRVHPTFVKNSHPLSSVSDSFNAVYLTGDSVDEVMLYGRGAGALPTGSAIVGDVLYCATHSNYCYSPFENTQEADVSTKFIDNFESEYYIRLNAIDKTGVLSKVSSVLSKHNIGVAQLVQEQDDDGDKCVPIVIITHIAKEGNVNKAIAELNEVAEITKDYSVIRLISK